MYRKKIQLVLQKWFFTENHLDAADLIFLNKFKVYNILIKVTILGLLTS